MTELNTDTDRTDGADVHVQLLNTNRTHSQSLSLPQPPPPPPPTPQPLKDNEPVPLYSCLDIAVHQDDSASCGLTACVGQRTKTVLARIAVAVVILILLGIIGWIEAKLGTDIINTEELVKGIKDEVDSLVGESNGTKTNG